MGHLIDSKVLLSVDFVGLEGFSNFLLQNTEGLVNFGKIRVFFHDTTVIGKYASVSAKSTVFRTWNYQSNTS